MAIYTFKKRNTHSLADTHAHQDLGTTIITTAIGERVESTHNRAHAKKTTKR